MKLSFASDYHTNPHPHVMKAMADAGSKPTSGAYGEEAITKEAVRSLEHRFGEGSVTFFVSNGSAANQLALDTLLERPYESVICAEKSHINVHECGGIERLGFKLLTVPTKDGKITLDELNALLDHRKDIHRTYPKVVSISNVTEIGTVYLLEELRAIGRWAHKYNFLFHIDGARLSNAAVHLRRRCLAEITFDIGADAVTLGATKNGGAFADGVIFHNKKLANIAVRLHKQHGQLCARQHFLSAQLLALYGTDLWAENAGNANRMATLLAKRCKEEFDLGPVYKVQSNAVFVKLPQGVIERLLEKADFYIWDPLEGIVRWTCSWSTTKEEVNSFIELIRAEMNKENAHGS
ncbi:MAG: ltaE [Patescibacteria group bacterium]|jgi:threonine aldolase|nr:ltaE [Patescibacteria group bacterium]